MQTIKVKPLSVNKAYRGRRFSTPEHTKYIKDAMLSIKKTKLPPSPYHITYKFGYSSPLSDVDGAIKNFQDILQKKFGFNDRDVFSIFAEKVIVKKGSEFISFEIFTYQKLH